MLKQLGYLGFRYTLRSRLEFIGFIGTVIIMIYGLFLNSGVLGSLGKPELIQPSSGSSASQKEGEVLVGYTLGSKSPPFMVLPSN